MSYKKYFVLRAFIDRHALIKQITQSLNKLLPLIVYFVYPISALFLLFRRDIRLLAYICIPASGFILCTIIRSKINAPRPYEVLSLHPIVTKDTVGKSFPSRHVACASVIASTAVYIFPTLSVFLVLISLLIAICRVFSGVHFVKDVIAGWLLGTIIGCAGMHLFLH